MESSDEAIRTLADGFELLCNFSRMIAMLPLEDWRDALERAETLGPVLDPTLYRKYLWSKKAAVLKELIEKAIPLKQAVLKAQPVIGEELKRQ